jgi:hypothetical protein
MTRSARSPDRHHSRHRDRSRSRSPLLSQSSHLARHQADVSASTSRRSDSRGAVRDAEVRVGHSRFGSAHGEPSSAALLSDAALRNGFPAPGGPSGHAFASVPPLVKPPSANSSHLGGPHVSALELERDARQQTMRQQQERDRLPFSASAAAAAAAASGFAASLMPNPMLGSNCDAATALLLRERMMTDQRDRMLLAAAAAEYESRSLRAADHPGLRPAPMGSLNGFFQPPLPNPHAPDALLGGASGMMLAAAQSALLRPSLNQPPLAGPPGLKLPPTFGPMMDSAAVGSLANAAAHLNLPFR